MSKAEQIIAMLDAARAEQETVYAMLSPEQRAAHGTWEKWSPKDFLGHFNFWQTYLLNTLDSLDQPPPQLEPFEVRNERNYRYYEARPYDEVYADYRASLAHVVERVQTKSDTELSEPNHFPRIANGTLQGAILGNTYSHMLSHLAELYEMLGDSARGFALQEHAAAKTIEFDPSPNNRAVTWYNLACAYAKGGHVTRTVELLREAFPLRNDLIEFSKADSDFERVRDQPEFQALYA